MTTTEPTSTTGESSTGAPASGETIPSPADMPGTSPTRETSGSAPESHAEGSTATGEGDQPSPGTEGPGETGSGDGDQGGKANALKAARQEARQNQAALTATRKAYAESMATGLHVPGDLWMDGVKVDRVLDDQGNVSPDLVKALAAEQLEKRPGLREARIRQHGGGGGTNQNRTGGNAGRINSWSGAAKSTKSTGYDSKL